VIIVGYSSELALPNRFWRTMLVRKAGLSVTKWETIWTGLLITVVGGIILHFMGLDASEHGASETNQQTEAPVRPQVLHAPAS